MTDWRGKRNAAYLRARREFQSLDMAWHRNANDVPAIIGRIRLALDELAEANKALREES